MSDMEDLQRELRDVLDDDKYEQIMSAWHKQMRQEKWDRRYLRLAKFISDEGWSHDPSTKVTAILVNYSTSPFREFIGYNGFPPRIADSPERYADRELKYKLVIHAEVNAISKAGDLARGSTLYVYPAFALPPICHDCTKYAIMRGVKEIVGYTPDLTDPRVQRWMESIALARTMCEEAGISWRSINGE